MDWLIGALMIGLGVFAFVLFPLLVAWMIHAGGSGRDEEAMIGNEQQGPDFSP